MRVLFQSILTANRTALNGWMSGIIVFLLGAIASGTVIWHFETMRVHRVNDEIKALSDEYIQRLHRNIDQIAALSYPIATMVHEDGTIDNFEYTAYQLLRNYPGISEIALAPEGIIQYVMPREENKKALGLNLLTDPKQKAEALLARKSGKLTLAGPLKLVQGGEGLVSRFPVFLGKEKKFWGFVIVVIRFPDILDSLTLEKLEPMGYHYTLSRIHPQTHREQIIRSCGDNKLDQPVERQIDLPNAQWTLRLAPAGGWHNRWIISAEILLGMLISLLLGYIAKQYTQLRTYRSSLERLVQMRTREIVETRNQLHTLLDTIPDLIWLKNREGVYLLCNPMFERFFGAKEEAIVGKTDYDFVDVEMADFFRQNDRMAMEKNAPSINEEWVTFADDGHRALLETIKAPVMDETGTLIGVVGIARDITQHKHIEEMLLENEEKLRQITESAQDAIVMIDNNGLVTFWNKAAATIFGYTFHEVLGRELHRFLAPDHYYPAHQKGFAHFRTTGEGAAINNILELVALHKDGHEIAIELSISAVKLKGEWCAVGIMRDITERNLHQNRIQQLSHLYSALSHCNKAIVRSTTPEELFEEVCRGIVTDDGMVMAWIGVIDSRSGLVRPVASYGSGIQYLDGIEISTDKDTPSGKGPTGTAIRENRPYWCEDFMHDPATEPWRERGETMGWKASASLPIHRYGQVIGAFMVYAKKTDAFDPASRELLMEMAVDISYAMENFDREAQRKAAEEDLIRTEQLLEEMSAMAHIGGWEFDVYSQEGSWTAEVARIHDMDPNETINVQKGLNVYEGEWRIKIESALHEAISHAIPYDLQLLMTTQKGTRKWVRTIGVPVVENGEVVRIRGSMQDITLQKTAEEKAHWLAHFDPLTGLPNRTLMNDRVNYAIRIASRTNASIAVLYLDLDHFKNINDSLGHHIGDDLLVQVSSRIQSLLREVDTLSRQGGDEFLIVLPNTDGNGATHVAEKLITEIIQPFNVQGHDLTVTPSIGIALYPIDGNDFHTLYQSADAAMYRAKKDGRNCFRFFAPEIQAHFTRNLELENALRTALQRQELELYYQPQIAMGSGALVGAEALLRWKHPVLGNISPAEFIPIAEESGQIIAIGEWVLRRSVQQLKEWMDAGIAPFIMAVNLSAIQFRHPALISTVLEILDDYNLPAQYLELELTERVATENPLQAIEVMNSLHQHGIRMSIDDFGTGYSSLNYLKQFQVYKLKIDQSFIHEIAQNPEDKTIVRTIINMAHNLNMITIAEGVETIEQLEILRESGCDELQGYYYSRPLPAEEFAEFVHKNQ